MKPTGDRLGRWEKATPGNLWKWIKSTMERHRSLYADGYRMVNSDIYGTRHTHRRHTQRRYAGEQDNREGLHWETVP